MVKRMQKLALGKMLFVAKVFFTTHRLIYIVYLKRMVFTGTEKSRKLGRFVWFYAWRQSFCLYKDRASLSPGMKIYADPCKLLFTPFVLLIYYFHRVYTNRFILVQVQSLTRLDKPSVILCLYWFHTERFSI